MSRPISLDIRLLGPLEVLVAGERLVVDTRKALAIVALVATEGRPFARDELAATLWPDADDESARSALRRTLSTLRASLGGRWINADRARVALDGQGIRIDLARAAQLAAGGAPEQLAEAAAIHRGPFLAGFSLRDAPAFDDWQAARATAVAASLADILDRLTTARLTAGDGPGATEAARRRVEADPLDETGQRRLIEVLALIGDRAGAIRQYRACVAVLEAELGVAPLDETTALYERIRDEPFVAAPKIEPPAVEAPSAPVGRIPLVGRDGDLAVLVEAHSSAADDGAVAIVEGEVGIGKTRLSEAVAAEATLRGARVVGARCYSGEQGVAYSPIIALLRAGLELPGGQERLSSLSPVAQDELAGLVSGSRQDPRHRPRAVARLEGPAARARLLDAVADALAVLGRGTVPGLVWLDDLQWADASTLEAVGYLARRLAGRPLLLLVTWRREDLDGTAVSVAAVLERAARIHLRLGRLDPAGVAALIAAVAPARASEPGLVEALVDRSEGLPLFVVEALAAGVEADGRGAEAVPTGVRALLSERLATLEGAAAQLLAAAAVIGRSFDLETIRRASGRTEEEAVDGLERLVRRGFLREVRPAPGGHPAFDFVHGSLQALAYAGTGLARRRLLHRRVAEALAGRSVDALADPAVVERLDGSVAASVALHLQAAGHAAEAALAYARAADQARRVHAISEAAAHVEAALALGYHDPGRLHALLGDLRTLRGEYGAAIRHYEAAAAHVPGDDPAALARLDHRLALVHQRWGDTTAADGHFAAALAGLRPGAERARVLADRSLNARDRGALDEAARLADEALADAEAAGERDAIARASNVAGVLATERGDLAAGRGHLERSLTLATDGDDMAARIAALNNLARVVAAEGDPDRAIELTESALGLCEAIGDRHREAALHNNLADLLRAAGRRDAAMAHLKAAVSIFSDVGEPGTLEPGKWRMATW
jgi:DNA-binding SARP family transcriptional activator/tetratricopeptide (TPR) repeat protein